MTIRESISRALRPHEERKSSKPISGEHPAVVEFRSKLMSLAGHADQEFEDLDEEISQCGTERPPSHPD